MDATLKDGLCRTCKHGLCFTREFAVPPPPSPCEDEPWRQAAEPTTPTYRAEVTSLCEHPVIKRAWTHLLGRVTQCDGYAEKPVESRGAK